MTESEDGETYFGEMKNGVRNGFGQSNFKNGNIYIGHWKEDKMSGKGTFIWKSGGKYVGELENDNRNGFGKNYFSSGNTYEGQWKDDIFVG